MKDSKNITDLKMQIAKASLDLRSHRVKDTNVVKKLRKVLAQTYAKL